jgi:hypothetical protein
MNERSPESHKGQESRREQIARLIDEIGSTYGTLYKVEAGSAKSRAEQIGIDKNTQDRIVGFRKGEGRVVSHVIRLIDPSRTSTEQTFANAVIDDFEKSRKRLNLNLEDEDAFEQALAAQDQFDDEDRYAMALEGITNMIAGDRSDTNMWWTIAPYIFETLTQKGLSPQDAMDATMMWALNAGDMQGQAMEPNIVHLPGVDLPTDQAGKSTTFVLSPNPEDPSHELARLIAINVIDQLPL